MDFCFVSDLFKEQYSGGAELTTEVLINEAPKNFTVSKINSNQISKQYLENNNNKHYIVCNFSNLSDVCKIYMAKNISYSIVEYDYKLCKYRSLKKHQVVTGKQCDCLDEDNIFGKISKIFYSYADKIWFMSDGQKNIFLSKIQTLKEERCETLSSMFEKGDLRFINNIKANEKNDKYLILDSTSWIKGTQECIKYAKNNNIPFETVKNLPYHEMLIKLSLSKGLIFMPLDYDTCPRIVIEAKMLGCNLIINENVQHKNESWFKSQDSCSEYVKNRPETFWKHYEQ
jgi:hypothetical protein